MGRVHKQHGFSSLLEFNTRIRIHHHHPVIRKIKVNFPQCLRSIQIFATNFVSIVLLDKIFRTIFEIGKPSYHPAIVIITALFVDCMLQFMSNFEMHKRLNGTRMRESQQIPSHAHEQRALLCRVGSTCFQ